VTVTCEPGTDAPLGSVTRPVMEPRNSCALADATISPKPISVSRQQDRNLLVCSLLNFMISLLLVSVIRAFLSMNCRNGDFYHASLVASRLLFELQTKEDCCRWWSGCIASATTVRPGCRRTDLRNSKSG